MFRTPPPLLILVKSLLWNAEQRRAIRDTWGAVAEKFHAKVVFLLGSNKRYRGSFAVQKDYLLFPFALKSHMRKIEMDGK